MHCDDGTADRQRPGKVTARLRDNDKFSTYRSFADPHSNTQAFFFVEGKIVSHSRAKGHLYFNTDAGVGVSGEEGPACSTFAAVGWKAT